MSGLQDRPVKRPADKNNRRNWLIGLGVFGVVLAASVWFISRGLNSQPDLAKLTVPVEQRDLDVRISASGSVVPRQTVNLSPKTAGRIAELYVEQGDRVKQGQVIARMENADVAAQLIQARANVAQTKARLAELRAGTRTEEIAQAKSNLTQIKTQVAQASTRADLARERVRRNQSLMAQGAISADRLDEIINDERSTIAALEGARAGVQQASERLEQLRNGTRPEQVAQARAQVDEAVGRVRAYEVQWSDSFVRAPFAGIITQKYATAGAFVTPTTTASSTTSATSTSIIALAQGLEVLAKVPEVDIRQIRPGQQVEIVADAYTDQTFKGTVRLVAPEAVVEQNVTSFQVRVAITSGLNTLRSGMNVSLSFLGSPIRAALVVPTVALVTRDGQSGVLVPGEDRKPTFHPVTLGPTVGDRTQIFKGVRPGERVFVDLPGDQKPDDEDR